MRKNKTPPVIGRIPAFLIFLFFFLSGIGCLWGGFAGLTHLYSYQEVISFHKIVFILLIIAPISFLCSVGGIYIALTGKHAPLHVQSLISQLIFILFDLLIIALPISNIYLTSMLEKRGYILCPRVLGESVVGGGRTWALSKELCLQNRLERESSTRNRLQQTE